MSSGFLSTSETLLFARLSGNKQPTMLSFFLVSRFMSGFLWL